jgi:hypothetical protein
MSKSLLKLLLAPKAQACSTVLLLLPLLLGLLLRLVPHTEQLPP